MNNTFRQGIKIIESTILKDFPLNRVNEELRGTREGGRGELISSAVIYFHLLLRSFGNCLSPDNARLPETRLNFNVFYTRQISSSIHVIIYFRLYFTLYESSCFVNRCPKISFNFRPRSLSSSLPFYAVTIAKFSSSLAPRTILKSTFFFFYFLLFLIYHCLIFFLFSLASNPLKILFILNFILHFL